MAIRVWLLEVIAVDYQHYLNTFKPVVSTIYVEGHLYRRVFTSGTLPGTSAWPTPSQPQISTDPSIHRRPALLILPEVDDPPFKPKTIIFMAKSPKESEMKEMNAKRRKTLADFWW